MINEEKEPLRSSHQGGSHSMASLKLSKLLGELPIPACSPFMIEGKQVPTLEEAIHSEGARYGSGSSL